MARSDSGLRLVVPNDRTRSLEWPGRDKLAEGEIAERVEWMPYRIQAVLDSFAEDAQGWSSGLTGRIVLPDARDGLQIGCLK